MSEKMYIGIDNERIEATGEVLDQILKDRVEVAESMASMESEKAAKATAKAALLERLGITADEAALLLQ